MDAIVGGYSSSSSEDVDVSEEEEKVGQAGSKRSVEKTDVSSSPSKKQKTDREEVWSAPPPPPCFDEDDHSTTPFGSERTIKRYERSFCKQWGEKRRKGRRNTPPSSSYISTEETHAVVTFLSHSENRTDIVGMCTVFFHYARCGYLGWGGNGLGGLGC